MGKTRDLFKKIRDTKGTFHAKMGSISRQKERRTKFIRGGGGQVATPTWGDFDTSEFSDPNGVSCNSILTLLRVGADLTPYWVWPPTHTPGAVLGSHGHVCHACVVP